MSKINDFLKNLNKKPTKVQKGENIDNLFDVSSSWNIDPLKGSHLSVNSSNKDDDDNIISFINDLFLRALQKWASDIHLEPTLKDIRIRFRIDWVFVNYKNLDLQKLDSFIARIKIMAYLRIDEHRLPQDWKINFNLFGWKSVDLRVSIMPTIYWEKVVIRLLKKEETPPDLKDLWILPYNMVKIKKHLGDSHGMILAVWPTGSGKSTTLFSLLSQFNPEENNISTLEDPVEYRIPGVNHTQINPSIWFNFSDWLRALLRQDPDIIMVWEVRDSETAKLAIEASITWHLVFSTLHTNSASHTIWRLLNLWIDPLLLSSSLRLIVSQRLARKLCPECKESYIAPDNIKDMMIGKVWKYMKNKDDVKIYKHKEWGCEKCNNTWYKGRIWIYEILEMSEKMENLLLKNASRNQIEIQAIWDWMVTISEDAFLKVLMWDTSIEEVLSVLWI
jgi:type IV pilus assembly protein PilB